VANNPLASQEIPHILWNQKVHYHVYSSAPHNEREEKVVEQHN